MSESAASPDVSRYPFGPYPRGWFRVAYSDELGAGDVKRLQYFGRELVAFRGESGRASVFDAHCPHLGAHLGVGGEVVGDRLRCPFHHWEFGGDGRCEHIPYAERVPKKAKLRRWPSVERNGLLLVYHDPAGGEPSFEIPMLDELGDPAWTEPQRIQREVRASWLDMNENCVDQAHFVYIHGTLSIPPTTAEIDGAVHTATSIFTMKVPGGTAESELVTVDHGPGFQVVHIDGLIPTLMVNTSTPIDAERTDLSFAYTVRTQGETRKEHLASKVIADLENQLDHDVPIWENKRCWTRPVLCDGDGPVSTYRRWYAQFV